MKNMFVGPWHAIVGKSGMPGMSWAERVILLVALCIILAGGYLFGKFFGNPIFYFPENRFWIVTLLVITFLIIGGMMSRGVLKIKNISPHMIVSFELAKTEAHAQNIIDAWEDNSTIIKSENVTLAKVAEKDIKLDFAFIVAYATLLSFLSFWISNSLPDTWIAILGTTFGWSSIIAGLLDVIENIALLKMLASGATDKLAQISFWTALPKLIITLWIVAPFILVFGLFSLGNSFLIKK